MLINADFSRRVRVTPGEYQWVPSPQEGVERVMLDRIGAEKARATSIVRYAPDSRFPPHEHPGGEEILVLSGTFSEDDEHYPAGWYMRNPPKSQHRPSSREGATLFVKLQQMQVDDTQRVRVDTHDPASWQSVGDGRAVCPLFSSATERVQLLRMSGGEIADLEPRTSCEVLVLDGKLLVDGSPTAAGTWMRFPLGDAPKLAADAPGVTIYLKQSVTIDTRQHVR